MTNDTPTYLKACEQQYGADPRGAALAWFRDAKYGLFLHYGLYSVDARHEWVRSLERIAVADYAKLADRFTADRFDAGYICDLALDAGMKYVNITTRHHDFLLPLRNEADTLQQRQFARPPRPHRRAGRGLPRQRTRALLLLLPRPRLETPTRPAKRGLGQRSPTQIRSARPSLRDRPRLRPRQVCRLRVRPESPSCSPNTAP